MSLKKIGGGAYEQSSRPLPKGKRLLSLLEKILRPLTEDIMLKSFDGLHLLNCCSAKQNIGDNLLSDLRT